MKNKSVKGDWYRILICEECSHEMSNYQKMYSKAICPYCGNDGGCTICNTVNIVIRKVKHLRSDFKWYEVWKSKYIKITYEGKDKISQEWLDKTNKN